MTIYLYDNKSDHNVLDKDIDLLSTQSSVSFLGDVDIEHPRLVLKYTGLFNYLYIPSLGRYYHAKITLNNDDIMTVECSVDPLMSFKDSIMGLSGIAERQTYNCDTMLVDNTFSADNKATTLSYPFNVSVGTAPCYILQTI